MKDIHIYAWLALCLVPMVILSIQPTRGKSIELNEIKTAGTGERITDEEMHQSCFSAACHGSEKNYIPYLGDGFKQSQKVRDSVTAGRMPPAGWSNNQIKNFLSYVNSQ